MESTPSQKRSRRSIAPAIALAAVAWAGAACGSGQESGKIVASMAPQANSAAFAQCVRKNGVPDFKDPQPGAGKKEGTDLNDLNTPAFKKAAEACKQYQPQSIPNVTASK
ncbi:MAG: hypothetical protein JWQ95_5009, partial [Sphaerisporangium sp.]|nr:hypothetical protein [Sphaerisporangium sp.]